MAETNIFVFGDSLSDMGKSFAFTGGKVPPFPYFDGRFSNGKVAVEYLANQLGSSYTLSLQNNFAFGGATTGQGNSNEDDLGVDLPGLSDQINAFATTVGSGGADANGLYVVWAGPNDFLDTLGGSGQADPAMLLRQGTLNLVDAATTLENLGAENIVLPNMLNLGRLPASQRFRTEATAITKAFNASLSLELGNLDFAVTQVDLFSAGEAIASDPAKFGFSNVTTPLLSLLISGNPPANPQEYFFWDQYHPTTQGHAVFGDTIYRTVTGEIPQPSFTNIAGTRKADFLQGTAANDNMDGFGGQDILLGGGGDDQLEGWNGNDQLFGGSGNDILHGNADNDVLWGGLGDDVGFGGDGNDSLWGEAGNDILVGDDGNDALSGNEGNDYLLGGQGQDNLWGDAGEDILNGGLGKDVLIGGAGNDRLDGGADGDRLTGGDGADQFVYRPGGGADKILDFTAGVDRIDLSSFKFANFAAFSASVSRSDSTIDFGGGNSLKLMQVDVSALSEADVILA